MSDVIFRDLSGMAEFRAAEALQREVWGEGDLPDPADLMMVIQAEGGLVGGAFVGGRLMGYVFGFPTREPQVQHSHRLAVLPAARGLGLGVRLKLFQRDWCLTRGISHVRWTFDPLRAVNAGLNLHRLGVQTNTYLEDYYGEMGGINQGIASDRLLVDWDLASPTVERLARGQGRLPQPTEPLPVVLPDDIGGGEDGAAENPRGLRARPRGMVKAPFAHGPRLVDFDQARRVYLLAR